MPVKAEFVIKAYGVWKEETQNNRGGWEISSKNPEIPAEYRYSDYEEGFEAYRELLNNYVKTLIPSGCPEVEVSDPVFKGKSDFCKRDSGRYIIKCKYKDVKISWIISISHQPNRTLGEFEPEPSKSVLEEALPKLQELGDKEGFTVSLKKGNSADKVPDGVEA